MSSDSDPDTDDRASMLLPGAVTTIGAFTLPTAVAYNEEADELYVATPTKIFSVAVDGTGNSTEIIEEDAL